MAKLTEPQAALVSQLSGRCVETYSTMIALRDQGLLTTTPCSYGQVNWKLTDAGHKANDTLHRRAVYGQTRSGRTIKAPEGWTILPAGVEVPQQHREFHETHGSVGAWAAPRRCRGTMTPLVAGICGSVRVFAVPSPSPV